MNSDPEIKAKKIRYIFTIAMKPVDLPDDPLAQKLAVEEMLTKMHKAGDVDRVGLVAVMEE